jgi:hypothetical protein
VTRAPAQALLVGLALLLLGGAASAAPAAQAATVASIHPSLRPDRLGASTALTLALDYSNSEGGEEGVEDVPSPVRTIVVRLPAGLRIDLRGVQSCPVTRLRRQGASGCPSGSRLGRGYAALEVHAGSQTLPEQATAWAFRGPDRGASPTLEILSQGYTPLDERTISTGVLESDRARNEAKLTLSIPPIPTLVYEPDASITSLSLTIGRVGTVGLPSSCPAGGFAFAAVSTFADDSTATATATAPCP